MKHSEFWWLMAEVFGNNYAKSLSQDLILSKLGNKSAIQALEDGISPREVWDSIADAMEISQEQRWRWRDYDKPKKR